MGEGLKRFRPLGDRAFCLAFQWDCRENNPYEPENLNTFLKEENMPLHFTKTPNLKTFSASCLKQTEAFCLSCGSELRVPKATAFKNPTLHPCFCTRYCWKGPKMSQDVLRDMASWGAWPLEVANPNPSSKPKIKLSRRRASGLGGLVARSDGLTTESKGNKLVQKKGTAARGTRSHRGRCETSARMQDTHRNAQVSGP